MESCFNFKKLRNEKLFTMWMCLRVHMLAQIWRGTRGSQRTTEWRWFSFYGAGSKDQTHVVGLSRKCLHILSHFDSWSHLADEVFQKIWVGALKKILFKNSREYPQLHGCYHNISSVRSLLLLITSGSFWLIPGGFMKEEKRITETRRTNSIFPGHVAHGRITGQLQGNMYRLL